MISFIERLEKVTHHNRSITTTIVNSSNLPTFLTSVPWSRQTQHYLINDNRSDRSSFSALVAVLCNEVMNYAIIGCGGATQRPIKEYDNRDNKKFVEHSQNEQDPVEIIVAFIRQPSN
ncbi:hypothetical protein BLNAU_3830 [Blattamonas nauphoetae]|uniref:Uncharacterized protein n=1 Tax=Blattamonas nauphoetae TaxID=2049346 RepID=A0ABQ9YBB2_9EUKA|nr:hypothetical protein BLNAU_3830 [Blattamonas nauphoetae]